MDTLIIQVGARQGRLANIVECDGDSVMLGRSFENDVVLYDPYIASEQLKLVKEDGRWVIKILDETNPVLLNGCPVEEEGVVLSSGDKLIVGRTRIFIFSKDHKFGGTRKLLFSSWLYNNRLGSFLPIAVVLVASFLSAFYDYLDLSKAIEYRTFIFQALLIVLYIFLWASLWALVGRLLRHQLHFYANLLFTAIAFSVYVVVAPLGEYLEYLTGSLALVSFYDTVIFLAFLTILLRFNLSLSSHLKNSGVVAFCVSMAFLLYSYGVSEYSDNDFSAYAEYTNTLKPPFAKLQGNMSVSEYVSGFESQFDKLDDMIKED
jgi:hypothetical protein